MNKLFKRVFRWVVAISFLPLLWAVYRQIVLMGPMLWAEGYQRWWLYAAGGAGYFLLERTIAKPMWLYVVGHELTHAVTGLMSGAKIHSFKAKSTGGEVRLSKSSALIALSPYVVPLYAVVVIGVYLAAKKWWNHPAVSPVFQVLLGAAMVFHLSLTWAAVHRRQPDLKVMGYFLSVVVILIGNGLIIGLLGVSLFSNTPGLKAYGLTIAKDTKTAWIISMKTAYLGWIEGKKWMEANQWIQ